MTAARAREKAEWTRHSALLVTIENLFRKTPLTYDARNPYVEQSGKRPKKFAGKNRVRVIESAWVK